MLEYIIEPMCSYSPHPAHRGARLVVSDRGDSLSPKMTPLTTAPAVMGKEASSPAATPIIATPIVPAEPQLVPVTTLIRQQIKKVHRYKSFGSINFKPK